MHSHGDIVCRCEARPEFSVLVTCYCEENVLDEFHARLAGAMRQSSRSYEVVYVDDASPDGTFQKLQSFFETDENVGIVVRLLGNVGQTNAQTAAIVHATGRHYIFIDADLQVDPEDVLPLLDAFDPGVDLVSGNRKRRRDPLWRRVASIAANRLLRRVSRRQIGDIGCGFKVLNGELVNAFRFSQYKPFRPVSVVRAASVLRDVPINHHPRRNSKSRWTVRQLVGFYRNIFVETAENFFHLLTLACLLAGGTFLVSLFLLWGRGWHFEGWMIPGILVVLTVCNAVVTVALLGLLGEFTMRNTRIFQEDPVYIVREKLTR